MKIDASYMKPEDKLFFWLALTLNLLSFGLINFSFELEKNND